MNPLAHVRLNTELLTKYNYKGNRQLVILGGVLPDMSELGLFPFAMAHEKSLEFIDYLKKKDPEMVGLGIGFMLHGEIPKGYDHHTHRQGGYIDKTEMAMYDIIHKHKPRLDPARMKSFIHTLTEFSIDLHVDKRYAKILNDAARSQDLHKIAFHIYSFFGGSPKKTVAALHFFRKIDFTNLTNVGKVCTIWKSWMTLKAFSHGNYLKNYLFLSQAATLTRKATLKAILLEAKDAVGPSYEKFHDHSFKELEKEFFKKNAKHNVFKLTQ